MCIKTTQVKTGISKRTYLFHRQAYADTFHLFVGKLYLLMQHLLFKLNQHDLSNTENVQSSHATNDERSAGLQHRIKQIKFCLETDGLLQTLRLLLSFLASICPSHLLHNRRCSLAKLRTDELSGRIPIVFPKPSSHSGVYYTVLGGVNLENCKERSIRVGECNRRKTLIPHSFSHSLIKPNYHTSGRRE